METFNSLHAPGDLGLAGYPQPSTLAVSHQTPVVCVLAWLCVKVSRMLCWSGLEVFNNNRGDGGFVLAFEVLGKMFDHSFPASAFSFP